MARVIKAGGEAARAPRRPVPRMGQPGRPVIEKEVWSAQQKAEEIHARAEQERERILAEGKRQSAQAREEAQAEGAQEAFAKAAEEALAAFRHRAERYAEAADDIRTLALEVVHKILGGDPHLPASATQAVLDRGMARLRARRRLRVQVPEARLVALSRERPALLSALTREPDLVLEAAHDVSPGFARVVTEVGGALCSEQTALDQLAVAVDVDEHAVAPRPRSALQLTADPDEVHASAGAADDDATYAFGHVPPRPVAPVNRRGDLHTSPSAPTHPHVHTGHRVRPLDDADPDETMQLDVSELQDELSEADLADDDLDLFADESLPDR